MTIDQIDGDTPLDPDEAAGLIPTHITTLGELNEWEQANIIRAQEWVFSGGQKEVLSPNFVRKLHRRMYGDTWTWAGQYRTTDKSIGIPWTQITVAVHNLCEDVKEWRAGNLYTVDEAATRFHHRLTYIHPFPNGNGRHARLITDALLVSHNRPAFTWGNTNLRRPGTAREQYISSLQAADGGNFTPLLDFLLAERD